MITKSNKNVNKYLITYQYRIKDGSDSLKHHLMLKSGAVNFVWNYCNSIQQEAVKRKDKWFSEIDLCNLTSGSSKELNLHSQSIQAICEEYVTRKIPHNAKIKTGNICCNTQGKWFINIVLELVLSEDEHLALTSSGQNISAIDPGLNPMLTLSVEEPDGSVGYEEVEPPKFFKRTQERLAKAQRANKKKLIRNLHKKIANQRKDFHNKLSNELVQSNHTIVNTDLSFKKLMQSKLKGHAKAWQDVGLGNFRSILKTKAKRHNVKYLEVSERILVSTQTCSHCNALTGPRGRKGLSVSAWTCSKCGTAHLRNRNSADNHRLTYKRSVEPSVNHSIAKSTLPDMGVYSGILGLQA